jgi:RNA polymerase sigma factor (sigma-70 family)
MSSGAPIREQNRNGHEMQNQERVRIKHSEVADGTLAQQALAGDQESFEVLVDRYSTGLFNFICHFLGDYHLACDVLQQVFLQLYISLPKLRTGEPFKSWLFQVARNRCLDELRRKRPTYFSELETAFDDEESPSLIDIPDNSPLPEEVTLRHDSQEQLQGAIQSLPPRFRSVVLLRYAGQLSFSEIGRALNLPESTAKTYFQRAKPLLRANLQRL